MNWDALIDAASEQASIYRFADPGGPALGKAGFHGSAMAGSSLEYKDFRDYRPGDDLRHLDWSAYGRTDRLIVKRYHDEVTPHLDLLLDGSASMDLPGSAKGEMARYLAAFFASVALNSSYTCSPWLLGEEPQRLSARQGNPKSWTMPVFDSSSTPAAALINGSHSLHRQGMRILITDTLFPDAPRPLLSTLAAGASAVLVLCLFSHGDLHPKPGGYARLRDSETGEEHQLLMDEALINRYQQGLAHHRDAWQEACRGLGIALATLESETFAKDKSFHDPMLNRFLVVR